VPRNSKKGKKKAAQTTGALIPQEHGGALRNGGTNEGGFGAPPSVIRERCRDSFYKRVPLLERIADGEEKTKVLVTTGRGEDQRHDLIDMPPELKDRIKALDLLGKYAGLEKITIENETPLPPMTHEQAVGLILGAAERLAGLKAVGERLSNIHRIEQAEVIHGQAQDTESGDTGDADADGNAGRAVT